MKLSKIELLTHCVVERYIMSGHLTPRKNPYLNYKRTAESVQADINTNALLRVTEYLEEAKSVACPTCGAHATGACLVKMGLKETFILTEVHQGRIDAYMTASLKSESAS